VRVLRAQHSNAKLELRLQVRAPGEAPGRLPFQVVRARPGVLVMRGLDQGGKATVALRDASGGVLKPRSARESLCPNPNGGGLLQEFDLVYTLTAGAPAPRRLVVSGPQSAPVDIPFTLRDVPISPEALPTRQLLPVNPYFQRP
jgi:hypothetical protein